jgi:transcriptional regulator NrdR family protein
MRAPHASTTIEETAFETVTVLGSQSVTRAFAEVKIANEMTAKRNKRTFFIL